MSATLGNSGELERITGVDDIFRLPMVNGWYKKGLGRRFFIFPKSSLKEESISELLIEFTKIFLSFFLYYYNSLVHQDS